MYCSGAARYIVLYSTVHTVHRPQRRKTDRGWERAPEGTFGPYIIEKLNIKHIQMKFIKSSFMKKIIQHFFFLHLYLAWNLIFQKSGIGLPSKSCPEKIPWNRLGTVFVIPRKKVLLSRNSMCLGIAHSDVQNRTEWNST
jgi:hypothetical protein